MVAGAPDLPRLSHGISGDMNGRHAREVEAAGAAGRGECGRCAAPGRIPLRAGSPAFNTAVVAARSRAL